MKNKFLFIFLFIVSSVTVSYTQTPTINYNSSTATRTYTVASPIGTETPTTNFSTPVYVKAVVSNMIRSNGSGALSLTNPGVLYPKGYNNYLFASGNGRVYRLEYGSLIDAYQTAPQGSRPSFPNMGTPFGVTNIAAGDLVSDPSTHRIYLITNAATPTVVAGNPSSTQSGDNDGQSGYALMNSPMSILPIPGQRNQVWVADKGNNKIKILNVETQRTTDLILTDNSYSPFSLTAPVGLATDPTGTFLYVTDAHRLIKIEISTSIATVLAGNGTSGDVDGSVGTSRMNTPMGMAVDGDGNIFIADKLNHKIKVYVPSTGTLVTIAGNGTAGDVLGQDQAAQFNQPVSLTWDYGTKILQVSDYGNNKVKSLTFTTAYTISPSLPAGLNFNTYSGVISGTPTVYTSLRNYTITLDNGTGTAQVVLPIQVLDIPPTNLSYSSSSNILTVGTAITNLLPSNTGGVIATYSVYPTLPAGLSLNTSNGIISGTPTEGTVQTDYVVTGVNTGGTITSTISIYVEGPPYNMGYSRSEAVFAVGSPVYLLALPKSFPAATSYALNTNSPALPNGLSLNTTSGEITGTPTTVTASRTILVDVTNPFGTATGQIVIEVMAAPSLSYVNPYPYLATNTITPLIPTLGGGPVTITAGGMNSTGGAIGDGAMPPYRSYPIYIYADGVRYLAIPGSSQGKKIATQAGGFSGALQYPAQVDFLVMDAQRFFYIVDNASKQIVKSTTAGVKVSSFGLISSNSSYTGFANGRAHLAQFGTMGQISTDATGASIYVPDISNLRIRKIDAINNVVTTLAGDGTSGTSNGVGANAKFTNPLAVALSIDGNLYILDRQANADVIRKLNLTTLEVSDFKVLPQVVASTTMVVDRIGDLYVTHATNTLAKVDRAGNYVVLSGPQSGNNYAFGDLSITPEGIVSIGGTSSIAYGWHYTPSESFSIRPKNNGSALFDGLSFNTSTAQITGTPSGSDISANDYIRTYTVTASNRAGIFESDVTITVVKPPSSVVYTQPSPIQVGSSVSYTPTGSFGVPLGTFTVSPTLPAGLSINPTTGVISGNAIALTAAGTYTVTCTNQYGSSAGVIQLEVADAPNISYVGPQVYVKNNAITSLLPTNTGGQVLTADINLSNILPPVTNEYPMSMTKDANGNIYVLIGLGASTFNFNLTNSKIVKIDPNNNITTIATSLGFVGTAIAMYGNDLLIAKPGNQVSINAELFIYSLSSNTVTSLGSANLTSYEFDIRNLQYNNGKIYLCTYDGNGFLYVFNVVGNTLTASNDLLDWGTPSNRTTMINSNSFENFTILPSGKFAFIIGGGGQIYYADYNSVAKDFTTNISTVNNTSSGLIYSINNDNNGNVIATTNNAIYKIENGVFSLIVGTEGSSGFTGGSTPSNFTLNAASNPLMDANGNILFIDGNRTSYPNYYLQDRVRKYAERVAYRISPSLPSGLTFDAANGTISGTATVASPSTSYTITAYNNIGSRSTNLNITVGELPSFTYANISATAGSAISTTSPSNTVAATAYTISPNITAYGLSFNTSTGAISGTPTYSLASTTFTVTGTNVYGASTATLSITILGGSSLPAGTAPTGLTYTNSTYTVASNTATNTVVATAPSISSSTSNIIYSISPGLPNGLSFNTSTGQITVNGSPITASLLTNYTVTATTAYGSTSTSFSLQVGAVPTGLSYPSASYSFWRGDAIANITATVSNGSGATSFTSMGMPAGLTIDPISGTIYGIPSTAQAAGTATITASNAYGATTYNISFTIIALPTITYNNNNQYATSQSSISLTPTITGGYNNAISLNVSSSTFSNTTGLNLNTSTGVIAGTASATALATTTYTATISSTVNGVNKTATNNFKITIAAPPSSLSYTSPNSFAINNRITNLPPTISNGAGVTYTATGLPTGLSIDPATGVIYGTPTVNQSATNASITATNVYGSTQATVSFAVGQAPSGLSFPQSVVVLPVNDPIPSTIPSLFISGSGSITYSISPSLVSGLSINTATGEITGSPTVNSNITYTVTATNSFGSTSGLIQIASGPVPAFSYSGPYTLTAGVAITNIVPTITSGNGTINFSIDPNAALPGGLVLDPVTGVISGTPTFGVAVPSNRYGVAGTNLYGGAGSRVYLEVQGPPTNLNYGANIVQPINVALSSSIIPTVVSSPAASFSVSPSLPVGLTFDPQTGAISGTPTVAQQATLYTFTADNWIAPSATYSLTITISAQPIISYTTPQNYVVGTAISTLTPSVQNTATSWSITPALPAGLQFNTSTGDITGTPTAAINATTYTITATNIYGNGTTNLTIAVAMPPTGLSYTLSNTNFATGVTITTLTPSIATGTGTVTYSVSPNLPAGLSINTSTGLITGTPTTAVANATYTITASNAYGSTSTSISFATGNAPSSLSYINSNTFTVGTAINTITPSITAGTGTTTYTVSPNLPAGLSINASTGAITGTPTAATANGTYTITATNAFGTTTANLQINVQGPPTNLSYPSTSYSFPINTAITTIVPSIVSNPAATFSISPNLPQGLSFNTTTGAITGTPTLGQAAVSYTITANNGIAPTVSQTIQIAVSSYPIISYQSPQTFVVNMAIGTLTPTVTNSVTSWSITPSLVVGLSFNTTTGAITGTPTIAINATSYTITATNSYGNGTTNLIISVATPPSGLSYTLSNTNFAIGTAITAITPSIATGTGTVTYSVSPNLPTGLNINTSTGLITGTPTSAVANATYTITASNAYGSTNTSISFATGNAPTGLAYTSSNTFIVGVAITAITPSMTAGTGSITYAVSPNLPAGLSINTNTGAITGTPTAATANGTYTITATNTFGTTTTNLQINVQGPPTNLVYPSSNYSFPINTAVTAIVPTIASNPVATFSISPNLPAGLSFNTTTGAITGTPTVAQTAMNYTITANNGFSPNTNFVLQIAVAAAPIISYTTPQSFVVGVNIGTITPTVQNAVTSWTVTPALPTGLSFNTNTGSITGTPTTVQLSSTYTVTATNNFGSGTAAIAIMVSGPPVMQVPPTLNNNLVGLQPINIVGPQINANPNPIFSINPNLPVGLVLNTQTGAITGTPVNYSPNTNYTLTATNTYGSVNYQVNLAILPNVQPISGVALICGKDHTTQLASLTQGGVWTTNSNDVTINSTGLATGVGNSDKDVIVSYTVTINGASNTVTRTVKYIALLPAAVDLPIINAVKASPIVLNARNIAQSYSWSPSNVLNNSQIVSPIATINNETKFAIQMTLSNGCVIKDSLLVRVFDHTDIELPNVFSPNGDGINDVLILNTIKVKQLNYFRIFNKWGQIVFDTNNLNSYWDGKYNGETQPLDTYTWVIDAIDEDGKPIKKAGSITLLR